MMAVSNKREQATEKQNYANFTKKSIYACCDPSGIILYGAGF